MKLLDGCLRFSVVLLVFVISISLAAAPNDEPSDGCEGALTPDQNAAKAATELLRNMGVKSPLAVATSKSSGSLRWASIPLDTYIDSLGLGERLYTVVPIKSDQDIADAVNGTIDPKKFVQRPSGSYPLTHFAIDPSGKFMAVSFHRTYFPDADEDRVGNVFISSVDQSKTKMVHLSEITLPNRAYGYDFKFLEDGRKLFVTAYWSENKQRRSDGFLYDLTNPKKPKLLMRLSKNIGYPLTRVTPLDSVDRDNLYYFVARSRGQAPITHSLIRINKETSKLDGEVNASIPGDVGSSIETMEYDDDRKGYVAPVAGGFRLISSHDEVELANDGKFRAIHIDRERRTDRRSSGSAWIISELSNNGKRLKIKDEIRGKVQNVVMPGVDFGRLTAMQDALLYTERNHPNYREFVIWPSGKVELATEQRLVHSEVHPRLIAGTTGARSESPTLELIFLNEF